LKTGSHFWQMICWTGNVGAPLQLETLQQQPTMIPTISCLLDWTSTFS